MAEPLAGGVLSGKAGFPGSRQAQALLVTCDWHLALLSSEERLPFRRGTSLVEPFDRRGGLLQKAGV